MAASEAKTFVLVHGAWHGGWCWRRVADRLRAHGHVVYTPTLTGLGERAHLAGLPIDLSLHVQDIAGVITCEDLRDVVLVGHSYGGMVISGVAEMVGDRISSIVFLDAFVPENRKSLFDYTTQPGGEGEEMVEQAAAGAGMVPPIPAAMFGVNAADAAWVDAMCVPQSHRCFTERLKLTGARDRIPVKAYILATGWPGLGFGPFAQRIKADPDWRYFEIATGHDAMLDDPEELTAILEACA